MYLSKIGIHNFRCFDEQGVEICLRPGVNVIIGENNTGKSALIDALRLAFSLGPGRRDIYVTPEDFHLDKHGTPAEEIALDLFFSGLSDEDEEGSFYDMLVVGSPMTVQLHLRYERKTVKGREKIAVRFWGGEKEGQPISSETLELINHKFLGALRDAERHLRPGRGSHLGQLLRNLTVVDEDKDSILKHVREANRAILGEDPIDRASTIINRNLRAIEGIRLHQQVQLGLAPPDFGRVVDSLLPLLPPSRDEGTRASFTKGEWRDFLSRHPDAEDILQANAETIDERILIDLLEIAETERQIIGDGALDELMERVVGVFALDQNGMGYNNIIYISTVLGDLQEWKSNVEIDSYNALLIEEPEAHLHPQLQDLIFDFLGRVSTESQEIPVQVFASSHSPTLTWDGSQ
jgi:putative ATP-dependent endonuclease of OLD family